MFISFVAIPVGLLLYYGLEDANKDFFDRGNGVTSEYRILYNDKEYHLGEMVSDMAAIVCLSITFGMISFVAHESMMVEMEKQ